MFGLSFWEIAIILGIALIVLGPKKLPELAKSLGKGIREFRKATDDFKSSVEAGMNDDTPPKELGEPAEIEPVTAEAKEKAGETEDEQKADEQAAKDAEAAAVAEVESKAKAEEEKTKAET